MSGLWFLLLWVIGVIAFFALGKKISSAIAMWFAFLVCVATIVVYFVYFVERDPILTHIQSGSAGSGTAALLTLISLPGTVVFFILAVFCTIKSVMHKPIELRIFELRIFRPSPGGDGGYSTEWDSHVEMLEKRAEQAERAWKDAQNRK